MTPRDLVLAAAHLSTDDREALPVPPDFDAQVRRLTADAHRTGFVDLGPSLGRFYLRCGRPLRPGSPARCLRRRHHEGECSPVWSDSPRSGAQ